MFRICILSRSATDTDWLSQRAASLSQSNAGSCLKLLISCPPLSSQTGCCDDDCEGAKFLFSMPESRGSAVCDNAPDVGLSEYVLLPKGWQFVFHAFHLLLRVLCENGVRKSVSWIQLVLRIHGEGTKAVVPCISFHFHVILGMFVWHQACGQVHCCAHGLWSRRWVIVTLAGYETMIRH